MAEKRKLTLDIDDIVNEYDLFELKTSDGKREFKIYKLQTLTIFEAQKKADESEKLMVELKNLTGALGKEKSKSKKTEINGKLMEISGRLKDSLSEQVYIVLKQDNPEITLEEIRRWDDETCVKFMSWFSEPFLAQAQESEEKDQKEKKREKTT